MAKEEWGTKRTCPKCGARFYDLNKEPVTCVACGEEFVPEPVLKTKQPVAEVETPKVVEAKKPSEDEEESGDDDDIDLGDAEVDVDLDDDDDSDDVLADVSLDDDDADLSDVVATPKESDD